VERSAARQPWVLAAGNHEHAVAVRACWLVDARADLVLVLAGHVHSYERSHRVSNVVNGRSTPVWNVGAPAGLRHRR
jgi:hypothetical protein